MKESMYVFNQRKVILLGFDHNKNQIGIFRRVWNIVKVLLSQVRIFHRLILNEVTNEKITAFLTSLFIFTKRNLSYLGKNWTEKYAKKGFFYA